MKFYKTKHMELLTSWVSEKDNLDSIQVRETNSKFYLITAKKDSNSIYEGIQITKELSEKIMNFWNKENEANCEKLYYTLKQLLYPIFGCDMPYENNTSNVIDILEDDAREGIKEAKNNINALLYS